MPCRVLPSSLGLWMKTYFQRLLPSSKNPCLVSAGVQRHPSIACCVGQRNGGISRRDVTLEGNRLEDLVKSCKADGFFVCNPNCCWGKKGERFRNELTATSSVVREPNQTPMHQLFSGLGYRFHCEFCDVYPDPKETEWSRLWHWVLALPTHNDFAKEQKKEEIFNTVVELFRQTGESFAKSLIDESFLPDGAERSNKPDHCLGGKAGGLKFSSGQQIFKLAVDVREGSKWIYGTEERNDRLAMKSAGHEFKSTQALIDAGISQLNCPLMAMFTYRGKRVLCVSRFPCISKHTIVQGRARVGDEIKVPSDDEVESVMAMMGNNLFIGKSQRGIYGPFDMEIHKGSDGLLYMIDAARLFPPEYRNVPMQGQRMYELLRPELLRKAKRMLLPDAVQDQYQEGLKDLFEATKVLDAEIDKLARELSQGQHLNVLKSRDDVKVLFHSRGINMRHVRSVLDKLSADCGDAREALQRARPDQDKMSCKLLKFPRELTHGEVRNIVDFQRKALSETQRMPMVPRLLQLSFLKGDDDDVAPLTLTTVMDGSIKRVGGNHPLVEAFTICEKSDLCFKKDDQGRITNGSYLTMQVIYELLCCASSDHLFFHYPCLEDLKRLSLLHGDSALKDPIERFCKWTPFKRHVPVPGPSNSVQRRDPVVRQAVRDTQWNSVVRTSFSKEEEYLAMRQAAKDKEWPLLSKWAERFGMDEALKIATEFGNLDFIQSAVAKRDAKLNGTLLIVAAQFGQLEICEFLLKYSPESDAVNDVGSSALILAAESGHGKVLECLIDNGCDMNALTRDGDSALMRCCVTGNSDIAKLLMQRGASFETSNTTVLMKAIENDRADIVSELLERKACVDTPNRKGSTPLMWAACQGKLECAQILLQHKANVNRENETWETPLSKALDADHLEVARLLCESNAYVNLDGSRDPLGERITPLMRCANRGSNEGVKLLLDFRADVNGQSIGCRVHARRVEQGPAVSPGKTALMSAAAGGHVRVVSLLIENRANVNLRNMEGWTALMKAAERGHLEVAEELLKACADIEAKSNNGWTALMDASYGGHIDVVEELIDRGADVNARDTKGDTSLKKAREGGHEGVVQLLEKHGGV